MAKKQKRTAQRQSAQASFIHSARAAATVPMCRQLAAPEMQRNNITAGVAAKKRNRGATPEEKTIASVRGGMDALSIGITAASLRNAWQRDATPREVIAFYAAMPSRPHGAFSNFYVASLEFDLPPCLAARGFATPVRCFCSEQAIMLCKAAAMGDVVRYAALLSVTSPAKCRALGRAVAPFHQSRWDSIVCGVAVWVLYQKFTKCAGLAVALLKTRSATIAEAAPADTIWGIGQSRAQMSLPRPGFGNVPANWRGANVLGWALMEVRERLRCEQLAGGHWH